MTSPDTIVLIHGFWVTPRGWEHWIDHYRAHHHKAVGLTFDQWNYAFTNTFDEQRAHELYERYAIPAPGRILWNSVLASFEPGHQDIWVDYKNDDRAPLLFVSGTDDHIMPPSVQKSNAKHYKSDTITEIKEYEAPHLLPAYDGWEAIVDEVLDWALDHAKVPDSTG